MTLLTESNTVSNWHELLTSQESEAEARSRFGIEQQWHAYSHKGRRVEEH